jgi:UDP-glucose 6-dehydrogenase
VSSNDRGFGGYCFPKDTAAILSTSELFNVDLSVIEAAVEYNNRIRND